LERDDPSRLTRQEDFSRKPLTKKILKKNPESRKDLEELGASNLKYWIRSKGYTVSHHQTTRETLLERAQEVWDVLEKDVPLRLTSQEDLSRKPQSKKSWNRTPKVVGILTRRGLLNSSTGLGRKVTPLATTPQKRKIYYRGLRKYRTC
jgi:hypothetical protein